MRSKGKIWNPIFSGLNLPFIELPEGAAPEALPEQPISALVALPELEPARDDPGNEDDGMVRRQPLLPELHPWRVGEGSRDRLRHVLGKRRRHRVIEEQQQPPSGAYAPDEPAAPVDARPLLRRRRQRRQSRLLFVVFLAISLGTLLLLVPLGVGFF